jgi:flagellar basal body rod protein FlgC
MDITKALIISARGMDVQGTRLRVIAENLEFPTRYDPSNPGADARGYVRTPNVSNFVELMDMRDAQRSYTANLSVMQVTRGMLTRAIEMLK